MNFTLHDMRNSFFKVISFYLKKNKQKKKIVRKLCGNLVECSTGIVSELFVTHILYRKDLFILILSLSLFWWFNPHLLASLSDFFPF